MNYLYVATGGAIGAVLRYVAVATLGHKFGALFPYGTLAVNMAGSLLIGVVSGLLLRQSLSHSWWLFLAVGLLGGFTTFSSFSLETVTLLERGQVSLSLIYALASVTSCILAAFVGLKVMQVALPVL